MCRFVVTSRHRLRIDGERVLTISSLPIEEGIALFSDRASGRVAFDRDDPAVRSLVERLDSIPLAIELAAARMGLPSASDILDELQGTVEPLRAAVDWTCSLLAPWERRALAQTAAFSGGFTLRSARQVLDPGDGHSGEDAVSSLVDWSLLRRQASDGRRAAVRFDTFRFIGDFAAALLQDMPAEAEDIRVRHANHYAELGRPEALTALRHEGGLDRRRALERERGNLCLATIEGPTDSAVLCAHAVATATKVTGPVSVGIEVMSSVLERELSDRDRFQLQVSLANALVLAGRSAEAGASLKDAEARDTPHLARPRRPRRVQCRTKNGRSAHGRPRCTGPAARSTNRRPGRGIHRRNQPRKRGFRYRSTPRRRGSRWRRSRP